MANSMLWVYVGTYTNSRSKGIYVMRLDLADGKMSPMWTVPNVVAPSFLAIHPSWRFLYAVNEVTEFEGKPSGSVSAFSIDQRTGNLQFLNQLASGGEGPCHLVVDRHGKYVLVANYVGGSVATLSIADDGRLQSIKSFVQHEGSSVNAERQEAPHAHSINLDAANRFAFAADLGLDQVIIYRFDDQSGELIAGQIPAATVKPGAGPRHSAVHPTGKFLYVNNELDSTVTAFAIAAKQGELTTLDTVSTIPSDFHGENSTAEVQVHPSGKFLYVSNRGHHSIAVIAIDLDTGRLTPVAHQPTQGETPRNFGIDPTGRYLLAANEDTDSIVVFRVDLDTGKLTAVAGPYGVHSPVCVKMMLPPE